MPGYGAGSVPGHRGLTLTVRYLNHGRLLELEDRRVAGAVGEPDRHLVALAGLLRGLPVVDVLVGRGVVPQRRAARGVRVEAVDDAAGAADHAGGGLVDDAEVTDVAAAGGADLPLDRCRGAGLHRVGDAAPVDRRQEAAHREADLDGEAAAGVVAPRVVRAAVHGGGGERVQRTRRGVAVDGHVAVDQVGRGGVVADYGAVRPGRFGGLAGRQVQFRTGGVLDRHRERAVPGVVAGVGRVADHRGGAERVDRAGRRVTGGRPVAVDRVVRAGGGVVHRGAGRVGGLGGLVAGSGDRRGRGVLHGDRERRLRRVAVRVGGGAGHGGHAEREGGARGVVTVDRTVAVDQVGRGRRAEGRGGAGRSGRLQHLVVRQVRERRRRGVGDLHREAVGGRVAGGVRGGAVHRRGPQREGAVGRGAVGRHGAVDQVGRGGCVRHVRALRLRRLDGDVVGQLQARLGGVHDLDREVAGGEVAVPVHRGAADGGGAEAEATAGRLVTAHVDVAGDRVVRGGGVVGGGTVGAGGLLGEVAGQVQRRRGVVDHVDVEPAGRGVAGA